MHATLIFYYKFSVSSHILIMRINMGPRKLSGPIVLGLFSIIIWKQKVLLSGELKGKVALSKKNSYQWQPLDTQDWKHVPC